MENTHNFMMPKINLIGVGAIKDLSAELLDFKLGKALIVTDKNMIDLGYVDRIETLLKSLFITYDIFDGIMHEPTVSFVETGLDYFTKGLNVLKRDYNLVISVGGGSNHDCAKAIAVVATNGGSITDYEGYNKIAKPAVPVICINTTGGSGAEVTMTAIIGEPNRKVKMAITSPELMPAISVNDPMFMVSMPRQVTASSGIDVIVHAIEAYVSTEASPITDSLSIGAIRIAYKYLPRAYENGYDMEAREQMMFASVMAGMAFNNAGLGYAHALAHQLGGFYHQMHGNYSAILLPHVLEFNAPSIPDERIFKIAEAMLIQATDKTEAADKIFNALQKLNETVGISKGLQQLGLTTDDMEQLAVNALDDLTTFVNPRKGTVEDLVNILKAAL
ncbi:MAG: iron-containing alcohol dehydrogenase [Syntrophomonas sp.]|nr:iron-containing alcohol dehydrogenase [Syntrophomonas sp.]